MKPSGLIIPHAAEQYSGHVTTEVLKAIYGERYETVILLGINHRGYDTGLYAGFKKFNSVSPLIRELSSFGVVEDHSITWIQRLLNQYTRSPILPVIIGEKDPKLLKFLKTINDDTLVIASSDLSHYHPALEARKRDGVTIENIISRNTQKLEACGHNAIEYLLALTEDDPTLITYSNSGAISGDFSSVVGYAGFQLGGIHPFLTESANTLTAFIGNESYTPTTSYPKIASFVTITHAGELQGCTGQVQPVYPLLDAVIMAFKGALRDSRFANKYQNNLEIKISLLTKMVPATLSEINIGMDGIYAVSGNKSAVFLPEVPVEQGWSLKVYIKRLLEKGQIMSSEPYNLYKFQTKCITLLV